MIRHLLWVLLLALFCPARLPAQTLAQADATLRVAKQAFDTARGEWELPPDTTSVRLAMKRTWVAEQKWAAAFLKAHPGAIGATWTAPARKTRNIPVAFQFEPLGHGAVLVATNDGELGTVFILAPGHGGLKCAWSIADIVAPTRLPHGGDLRYWSITPHHGDWLPLAGRVGRLPPQADGAARFYVDALHAQDAGATSGDQFSVWSWNGRRATPLYVRRFLVVADQPAGLRVHGNTIVLREKTDWRHFYSCGACNGRQRDVTLELTGAKVRALGTRSIHPELDRIDLLMDRIFDGRAANDIASPEAVTMLRTQLDDAIAAKKDPKQADIAGLFGMVMNWRIGHDAGSTNVCLALDSDLADIFQLVGKRIVQVRPVTLETCGGPGSDM